MWKLECFIICASCWHTCKLHLLGVRPQTAIHNNNPSTLSWTFIITERQKSDRLDLRVADKADRSPSGKSTRYNIQKWFAPLFSQIWCSTYAKVPQDSLRALQEQRLEQSGNNRGSVLQFWREVQQTTSGARRHINEVATWCIGTQFLQNPIFGSNASDELVLMDWHCFGMNFSTTSSQKEIEVVQPSPSEFYAIFLSEPMNIMNLFS